MTTRGRAKKRRSTDSRGGRCKGDEKTKKSTLKNGPENIRRVR